MSANEPEKHYVAIPAEVLEGIPEDLWQAVERAAERHGETIEVVIRRGLREYVAEHERTRRDDQ